MIHPIIMKAKKPTFSPPSPKTMPPSSLYEGETIGRGGIRGCNADNQERSTPDRRHGRSRRCRPSCRHESRDKSPLKTPWGWTEELTCSILRHTCPHTTRKRCQPCHTNPAHLVAFDQHRESFRQSCYHTTPRSRCHFHRHICNACSSHLHARHTPTPPLWANGTSSAPSAERSQTSATKSSLIATHLPCRNRVSVAS